MRGRNKRVGRKISIRPNFHLTQRALTALGPDYYEGVFVKNA
jgi:hypothetical protein